MARRIFVFSIILCINALAATDKGTNFGIGAGVGLPYGALGGRIYGGGQHLEGAIGIGLVPYAWEPVYSFNCSLHLLGNKATFRPHLAASYSNAVGILLFLEQDNFTPIYKELFEGFSLFAGFNWRFQGSPFFLDFNIGYPFPSVGRDEMLNRYEQVVDDLEDKGYIIASKFKNLDGPVFSLGLNMSF